jgi:putative transcriptional regulator
MAPPPDTLPGSPAGGGASEPISLAPGLLIAVPQLQDGNFHRSVVFLIEQNADGAFGVVINRPSEIRVPDLFENLGIRFVGSPDQWVLIGGPVSPERGLVLHRRAEAIEDARPVSDSLSLSVTPGALEKLFTAPEGPGPAGAVCFAGYAGWGPGQLEQEIEEGAWIPAPPDEELIFSPDRDAIWERALRALGIEPSQIVPGGSVN